MRHAIIAVVALAACAVAGGFAPERLPAIGAKVKESWVRASERTLCMTSPSQLDPCFDGLFDGVRYKVAYSSQTKRVTYVYTSDKQFRTTNGLRVNDELRVSTDDVHVWPGWEIHAATTSDGWRPIVGFNDEVKLKDGTVLALKLYGQRRDGSSSGMATISGFSRGRW